jgi:hypothetical protein
LAFGKVGVVGAAIAPTRDFSKNFFSVGIQGLSAAIGVAGEGPVAGVTGSSDSGVGVRGVNVTNNAEGFIGGTNPFHNEPVGVFGRSDKFGILGVANKADGIGVFGTSVDGAAVGVLADSANNDGLQATTRSSQRSAVFGNNTSTNNASAPGGSGVFGLTVAPGGVGVFGSNNSTRGNGVQGNGPDAGVAGFSPGIGVIGFHGDPHLQEIQLPDLNKVGVFGASENGAGVLGYASPGTNVFGVAAFGGLFASAVANPLAARFEGNVQINGDIFLAGADCAEHFDVADAGDLEPGTVMVINNDGILEPSSQAYDKRVAGVISGAGSHKTGIILDKQPSDEHRKPIALVGKVNCKVDARYSPVEVGDLLTTSPTPGHAMKASEPGKAFGSVIGKALRELREGRGLIPILIALQ